MVSNNNVYVHHYSFKIEHMHHTTFGGYTKSKLYLNTYLLFVHIAYLVSFNICL